MFKPSKEHYKDKLEIYADRYMLFLHMVIISYIYKNMASNMIKPLYESCNLILLVVVVVKLLILLCGFNIPYSYYLLFIHFFMLWSLNQDAASSDSLNTP